MVRVRAMAVFVIALTCYACGGGAASPPATSSSPAASATPASTTSSGAEFGVPECDDYLKKYVACIDKLAPAAQASARQAIEQSKAAWKQAAATEQGKAALGATCKAASDAAPDCEHRAVPGERDCNSSALPEGLKSPSA